MSCKYCGSSTCSGNCDSSNIPIFDCDETFN